MFPKISTFFFWNTSGAIEIPNGSLLNLYLPKGVPNVQRLELSSSNSIFQKPSFRSKTLKKHLPPKSLNNSSVVGIGKCARLIELFKCLGSKHILSDPFAFSTNTNALTQSVG